MSYIDLRSDTVTLPSDAMRTRMATAAVGDDQYGEDPTINSLQERVAELLGKASALFVPSGTMANQIALNVLTHPGDDVLIAGEAHLVWHETGADAEIDRRPARLKRGADRDDSCHTGLLGPMEDGVEIASKLRKVKVSVGVD